MHDDERLDRPTGDAVAASRSGPLRRRLEIGCQFGGIDAEAAFLALDEMRHRPAIADRVRGGDESERWHQHLIGGAHPGKDEAGMQGRRAVHRGHGMGGAGIGLNGLFEAIDIASGGGNPAGVETLFYIVPLAPGEFRLVQRIGAVGGQHPSDAREHIFGEARNRGVHRRDQIA